MDPNTQPPVPAEQQLQSPPPSQPTQMAAPAMPVMPAAPQLSVDQPPQVPPESAAALVQPAASPAPLQLAPPPDTVAQIAATPHSTEPDMHEVYAIICSQIIKEQGQVIGSLSYEQASKVVGLQVDPRSYACVLTGDPNTVLEQLVDKYRRFFGNAAVEVCREAAQHLKAQLPNEQIPALLRV